MHHMWRKREKERFYAACLLGRAWPEALPRRRKRNAALGDMLGRERDLQLVIDRLLSDWPEGGERHALRDLRKVRKRLAKRALELGRRVHADGA